MIELHTFGDAMIRVGEKEIRPSAPMLFAALLYLCVERGRRVPRAALQELLFPESDERSGAHSLRQLLYKLRQLGVPLENDASSVLLRDTAARVMEPDFARHPSPLPAYEPRISDSFQHWFEATKAQLAAAARMTMLKRLSVARSQGDAPMMTTLSSTLLALDPLNEEATMTRAEALAMSGQKVEAVRLLDSYSLEIGTSSPGLRLPVELLKKRISERPLIPDRPMIPLIGRSTELAMLLAHFERARSGCPTMSFLWGDAGIGKTRLIQEFAANISVRPAAIEVAHCRPHDPGRPMGPLIDLSPRLLGARGALAVSPESMMELRRLTGPGDSKASLGSSEAVAARIRSALEDLVVSVSGEIPLVLVIEDAHWLDDVSRSFLHSLLDKTGRVHLVVTSRHSPQLSHGLRISPNCFIRHIEPLSSEQAHTLLIRAVGSHQRLEEDVARQCVALAAGNALFLCTIGEYLKQSGSAVPTTATLADLLEQRLKALSPHAILLLRFTAAFGAHATHARLMDSVGLSTTHGLLALQEAADSGLIVQDAGHLKCTHDLLAELVLRDTPAALKAAIMEGVARRLELDGTASRTAALLWACADAWRQANDSPRAAAALRRCAQYAIEIGQPGAALEALERAQQYVTDDDLTSLLEETIRVADYASAVDVVFRNVERLREHRSRLGLPRFGNAMADFAVVNAKRRKSLSVSSERGVIETFALSPAAAPSDRARAARAFFFMAEEELDREASDAFFPMVQQLQPVLDEFDWLHVALSYHGSFGDLDVAAAMSHKVLDAWENGTDRLGPVPIADSSYALFRSGHTQRARHTHDKLVALGRRLQLNSITLGAYLQQAAMMALTCGELDEAARLHREGGDEYEKTGDRLRPAFLANAIELAIIERAITRARETIRVLELRHQECFTPNRERITTGHSLILDWLEERDTDERTLSRALALFQKGRAVCECDTLAVGLALSVAANEGTNEAGAQFQLYLQRFRRERFAIPEYLVELLQAAGIKVEGVNSRNPLGCQPD